MRNPMVINNIETTSECIPASTINRPMSDFPILRSVINRVNKGESVPARTIAKHELNTAFGCLEMCRSGVTRQAKTNVVSTPEYATFASGSVNWRNILGSISNPTTNM